MVKEVATSWTVEKLKISEEKLQNWENLKVYDKNGGQKVIEKGEPIFMRLNAEEEVEFIKQAMKGN